VGEESLHNYVPIDQDFVTTGMATGNEDFEEQEKM